MSNKFQKGDRAKIKAGASKWMRERGFWLPDWPELDGLEVIITYDYSFHCGDESHYAVSFPNQDIMDCGVHPDFLELISEGKIELSRDSASKILKCLTLLATCPPTVRQVIQAGDRAIDAAGLNPYCLNEGADGDAKQIPYFLNELIEELEKY